MDIKNVSKILKKINRLYEFVNEIGEASATEKDLLKAYVVDLYDAVITEDQDEVMVDLEKAEMLKKIKKQRKLEKKLKKQKEKLISDEEEIDLEPSEETKTELSQANVATVTDTDTLKEETLSHKSNALGELFDIDKGNEISDKLSQSPIKDLTKSMSINEKIFTVNELFGGNQAELDNILVALNGLKDFDEAKKVLMNSVAIKYNWNDSTKSKKAKNFIKLVKRRYN